MTPAPDSPESESPRKRGRKPLPEGQRRDVPHVVNLRADESVRAKAWAAAQGRPLGECLRGLLLPLIGACALLSVGCAGSPVKPLATACAIAGAACAVVGSVCDAASSGGEAAPE